MKTHSDIPVRTTREINDRIKARLAELGISATEAASRAGIAASTLTRPLNDPEHSFTLSTTRLTKLAAVLDCKPADLLAEAIGNQIREAREARGWSQAKLADEAGTFQQTVNRIEHGSTIHARATPAILTVLGLQDRLAEIEPYSVLATMSKSAHIPDLRAELDTAFRLLTALDKTGAGIGGEAGQGVSAVALAARAALDRARSMLDAMEGGK